MTNQLGMIHQRIKDRMTDTEIPVLLLYPTLQRETPQSQQEFGVSAALDADILGIKLPWIIISHDSGGSMFDHIGLCRSLARLGCFITVVEHPFDNANNSQRRYSLENWIDRPRHIKIVIDAISQNPRLAPYIDKQQVAIIGHGSGAYSALALSGAKPNTDFIVRYCNSPDILHKPDYCQWIRSNIRKRQFIETVTDSRVRALVLFSPEISLFNHEQAFTHLHSDLLIYFADDAFTLDMFQYMQKRISQSVSCRTRILKDASHESFLSLPQSSEILNNNINSMTSKEDESQNNALDTIIGEIHEFLKSHFSEIQKSRVKAEKNLY